MSRTYYQIYKEQTFVLARTLIVKHEEVASSMNTELYYRGYVVDSNPYTWRYYLNLSGEYHKADKDELFEKYGTQYMMVKIPSELGSIEVPLTKDLLHGNNADKTMMNEYQIGSKFYEELVSRYPDFETLIIGIINPIDIDVALNADNGEILFIAGRYKRISGERKWFDTTWFSINEVLIEEQEDNLILELQRYINQFLRHWNNPEYINGNDLYVLTMLGILYANIPTTIFNIRLGNCKTRRAHTFHIRQHLESFGQIGRYVDFLPIGTALWLYMNVHYLEVNAGKQKTFDLIMDNMLTPNEIPMSAYTARHELSAMDPDNPLPNTMLYKEVLNFSILGASDDDRTVLDILEDEKDMARDNDKDLDEKREKMQSNMDWGGDDRLNTKVLESEMIDIGEPYPFTLSQMLFNMWGYTAAKGYYTGTAYATNPLTGDRLSFNTKSAYILAMYCLNKAVAGKELTRIPSIRLYGIPRTDQPDDYPTDSRFLKKPDIDKMMSWCVAGITRRLKVLEVRGTHIPSFKANDSEKFFDNVEEIYLERVRRYHTYCDVENLEERGDLELVAKRLYWDGFEESLLDMDYDQWFRTIGFDITRFTDNDLLGIGLELVASSTGVSEQDDVRKKWLQKSLLSILKHFVSYTVHVIEKYTDGVVAYLEGQTLRYSNFKWTYLHPLKTNYNIALDYQMKFYVQQYVHVEISNAFENTKVSVNTKSKAPFDLSSFDYVQKRHRINVGTYSLGTKLFNIEFNTEKKEPVYITVIDTSINTIILNPMAGAIDDDDFIHVMDPQLSYVKPYDISAVLRDLDRRSQARDDIRTGLVIDGTFADITDQERNLNDDRLDNEGIVPHGLRGSSSDSAITDIGFIDSAVVKLNDITGNSEYGTPPTSVDVDNGVTTIADLSAGLSDDSVAINNTDSDVVRVNGMSIGFMDPQIPDVVSSPDIAHVGIATVMGTSQDVDINVIGISSNVMMLNNIDFNIEEDSHEFDLGTDNHVVGLTSITGAVSDITETSIPEDSATLIVNGISIGVIDDVTRHDTTIDANTIASDGIHASLVDEANATVIDSDTIATNAVTMNITDSTVNIADVSDSNSISIDNITAQFVDRDNEAVVIEHDIVDISSITMSHVDDNVSRNVAADNNSVSIANLNITIRDDLNTRKRTDDDLITIAPITGNQSDVPIEYRSKDNESVTIAPQLIDINITDPEFNSNIVEGDNDSMMIARISGSVSSEVGNYNELDSDSIRVGSLSLNISGSDDSIPPITTLDNTAVAPKGIRGNLVDYTFVQMPTDLSTVLSSGLQGYVKDYAVVIDRTNQSNVVQINPNNINIKVNDSDTMLDGVDSATISISNITMNLNEESDDSQ